MLLVLFNPSDLDKNIFQTLGNLLLDNKIGSIVYSIF